MHAVRAACGATRSSPKARSACRSTDGVPNGRCSTRFARGGAATATPGETSVLFGYALGKAQRLLAGLADADIGPIYTHGAVERLNRDYRAAGVRLADTTYAGGLPRGHDFPDGKSHRRAAVCGRQHVAPTIRQRLDRLCVGMDANPRYATAPRARSRLRAVGSRRLALAAGGHRRNGRRARLGDARHPRAARSVADASAAWRPARSPRSGKARRTPIQWTSPARRFRRESIRPSVRRRSTRRCGRTRRSSAMADYFATAAIRPTPHGPCTSSSGGRPKRLIPVRRLSQWAMEEARHSGLVIRGVL